MANEPKLWKVPKLWPDATCFILGGGPSLNNVDIDRLRGSRVIAVNNAYQLGDWIDVLFFGDCRWYHVHKKRLLDFAGLKVTRCEAHRTQPGIKAIKCMNRVNGLSKNPSLLSWNLSSGACAINLATLLGVKKIVLLGFDMRKIDNRNNWHSEHPGSVNPKHNPYVRFVKRFTSIAKDLKGLNVECINATPGSGLTDFPIVDPEIVLPEKKEICDLSVS